MGVLTEWWTSLYHLFGRDDFLMAVLGSWIVTVGTIWLLNLFLLPMDLTGKPEWINKFKVQPAQQGPVEARRVWGAVKTALFNQFVLSPPLGVLVYYLSPEGSCHPDNLPSGWVILRDVLGCVAAVEFFFYYSHRLIHWGPLYKTIHKKHHEWTAPIGITAIYAHPFEFIFGNVLPVVIGPLLMRSHLMTTWLWYMIALESTTVTHSGYHLPLLRSPQFHDYHHLKFNANYGSVGFLDWLHGTDGSFRRSVQKTRHRTLYGLKPIHEQYPDDKTTVDKAMKSG